MPRRAVLCADDFGLSAGVDHGVVELAATGRVTAVSCLAEARRFREDVPDLLATGVELGLHLELAGDDAVTPGRLLAAASLRLVSGAAARERIARQVGRFREVTGREPVFVDGHLHAHQFPVLRDAVLEWAAAQPAPAPVFRVTATSRPRGLKARLLHALGARFRRQLVLRSLRHYADFAGAYAFDARVPYRERMRAWLGVLQDGGVIMCHPSADGSEPAVPHAAARARELEYLRSDAFARDCAEAGVTCVSTSALWEQASR